MVNFLFWGFLLVCCLATPGVMIGFGSRWEKHPPDKINSCYGYRTTRSMLSQETWDFAHRYCGSLWRRAGWIALFATAAVFLPAAGVEMTKVSLLGGVVVAVQCVVLCLMVIPVERALKNEFDQLGHRKPGGEHAI